MFELCPVQHPLSNLISFFDKPLSHKIRNHTDLIYIFEDGQFKDVMYTPTSYTPMFWRGKRYIVFGKNVDKNKYAPEINKQTITTYSPTEKIINLLIDMNLSFQYKMKVVSTPLSNYKNSVIYTIPNDKFTNTIYHLVYSKDLSHILNDMPHIKKTFTSLSKYMMGDFILADYDAIDLLIRISENLLEVYPDEKSSIVAFKNELLIRKLTS